MAELFQFSGQAGKNDMVFGRASSQGLRHLIKGALEVLQAATSKLVCQYPLEAQKPLSRACARVCSRSIYRFSRPLSLHYRLHRSLYFLSMAYRVYRILYFAFKVYGALADPLVKAFYLPTHTRCREPEEEPAAHLFHSSSFLCQLVDSTIE